MSIITPRTAAGVLELLPDQQIAFQRMLDAIRRVYERFGFLPVETPAFETVEVLLTKSGGETEKQVYFVQSTGALQQQRTPDLALRFDLTVPLARYVAQHERELAFPFRRYQMQRVYRGERAQKGRFREFYQCDADIVGKDTLPIQYDGELLALVHAVCREIAFGPFTLQINNRKLLRGLLASVGLENAEHQTRVLREIDKLDKLGRGAVLDSLKAPEIGLGDDAARRLFDRIDVSGRPDEVLRHLDGLAIEAEDYRTGLAELRAVVETADALGVPADTWRVNLTIARGLDYYTGTVYETFLNRYPNLGSICSGGRYDDLASLYTKSRLPGVGVSIGATRLFSQLLETGLVSGFGQQRETVLVTQLDPDLTGAYLALASRLRAHGLNAEIQFEPGKIAKQLKYADRSRIPFVLLMGPDEQTRGVVTVKAMRSGEQTELPMAELPERLAAMLRSAAD